MYKQGDKAYIVQPELRNLPDYISEEHSDLRCILKILQDVARAIAILQEKGIVHLDVKPKNIFVDGTGQGKLGDFSTACEIASFAEKPYWGGTPKYFPPEVYKSLGYSGKEDMYSFGITMYYILSGGKYPYDFTDEVTRTAESEYIANGNTSKIVRAKEIDENSKDAKAQIDKQLLDYQKTPQTLNMKK